MSRNTKADNNINSINTDDFKHSILINKLYAYVISWLPRNPLFHEGRLKVY